MTAKSRADKCVTHHYACDCREYRCEQMERALKIIHTWASVPNCLDPEHVRDLCEKTLVNALDAKKPRQ